MEETHIHAVMAEYGVPYMLKPQQIQVIKAVLQKQSVFALLPTGFGKSDCYGWLSPIMDKINPGVNHITLVISPLKSLMQDQVERWNALGVTSAAIMRTEEMNDATKEGIAEGKFKLIFSSPEAIFRKRWWATVKRWRNRITALVIDEAHCMTKWGSFREDYKNISIIRSVLSEQPIMCLKATATQSIVEEIINNLNLEVASVHIISVLPDRPNIKLCVHKANFEEHLQWYCDLLMMAGNQAPKAIIYARQVCDVANIYAWLMNSLGDRAWGDADHTVHNRIVDMYHGTTDHDSQRRIILNFSRSPLLRCVVATMAFGMGVQITDVDFVIHWGPSRDVLSYWQEVGRCARDGRHGRADLYLYPRSVNKRFVDCDMMQVCTSARNGHCLRTAILGHLHVHGMETFKKSVPNCCSACEE